MGKGAVSSSTSQQLLLDHLSPAQQAFSMGFCASATAVLEQLLITTIVEAAQCNRDADNLAPESLLWTFLCTDVGLENMHS